MSINNNKPSVQELISYNSDNGIKELIFGINPETKVNNPQFLIEIAATGAGTELFNSFFSEGSSSTMINATYVYHMIASYNFMKETLRNTLNRVPIIKNIPFTSTVVAYALSVSAYNDCIKLGKESLIAELGPLKQWPSRLVIGISITADINTSRVFISLTYGKYNFDINNLETPETPKTLTYFLGLPTEKISRRDKNKIINNIVYYLILKYIHPDKPTLPFNIPLIEYITPRFSASTAMKEKISKSDYGLFSLDLNTELNANNLSSFASPKISGGYRKFNSKRFRTKRNKTMNNKKSNVMKKNNKKSLKTYNKK